MEKDILTMLYLLFGSTILKFVHSEFNTKLVYSIQSFVS